MTDDSHGQKAVLNFSSLSVKSYTLMCKKGFKVNKMPLMISQSRVSDNKKGILNSDLLRISNCKGSLNFSKEQFKMLNVQQNGSSVKKSDCFNRAIR